MTYLDVPDDSGLPPRTVLNGRGEVVATRFTEFLAGYISPFPYWWNPVSYFWADGEAIRLGEAYANVNDLSEGGDLVGGIWEPDGGPDRPILWSDGEQITLPLGDASAGEALAVNDHGTVAGFTSGPDGHEAAVWRDGEILTPPVDLPPDAMSFAVDINNRDQVLLAIGAVYWYDRLMLWEVGGEVREIGESIDFAPPVQFSTWLSFLSGKQMNEMGMVLLNGAEGGVQRSYLWHDGELTDLGSLGGEATTATALDEWGQVVGQSTDANGDNRPFLWYRGEMTEIDLPGDGAYWPAAINNWGQVVMASRTTTGVAPPGAGDDSEDEEVRLFLWQNGRALDLGALASDVEAWPVSFAVVDIAPHAFATSTI